MSEVFVELLVKRERNWVGSFLRMLGVGLTAATLFMGLAFGLLVLLLGVAFGVITYFIFMNTDLEYEYTYLDKELTIDKIMMKSKRKRVETYDMNRMELIAPEKSHQLDSYRNRQMKDKDYSSRNPKHNSYVMIYNGDERIKLETTREFMKSIQGIAPRKVFLD